MSKFLAIAVIALVIGLSFRFNPVAAPGFGTTCLNRHNAQIYSVLIHSMATNYTGHGDEQIAPWLWGYSISIFVKVNTSIMQNEQPDITNGSIFFANDIGGAWNRHCYYNVSPDITLVEFQANPANVTNFENSHQLVTVSTGTSSGQYNVSWIGP